MTEHEVRAMPHGLYRIHWRSGGYSLAARGSTRDGTPWIAPCNWLNGAVPLVDTDDPSKWATFESIERMVPVELDRDRNREVQEREDAIVESVVEAVEAELQSIIDDAIDRARAEMWAELNRRRRAAQGVSDE